MPTALPMRLSPPSFLASALLVVLATACVASQAQAVFRIVGPDGRVTFSDRPPPDGSGTPPRPGSRASANTADDPTATLPFELRQVVGRYPVTLYSSASCQPCQQGRAMLAARGIPFTERTVTTNEDIDALQRLAGDASLPLLTIGGQQLRGYSSSEWSQYLDLAGYPSSSQLPATYRQPAASPLVAVQRVEPARNPAANAAAPAGGAEAQPRPAAAPARRATTPQTPDPNAPNPSNPAGIRF